MPVSFLGRKAKVRRPVTIRAGNFDIRLTEWAEGTVLKSKQLPPKFYVEFKEGDSTAACWIDRNLVELL
jgi:hypothetical protein